MQSTSVAQSAGPGASSRAHEVQRQLAFARARQRWGELGLSLSQFTSHLDELGWVRSLPSRTDELYLCAACHLGVDAACRTLDRVYFPGLRAASSMLHPCPAFLDDVLQQARERLLVAPSLRIASYRGDGCLAGWLRVIVQRLAVDLQRSESVQRRRAFAEWQRQRTAPPSDDWLDDVDTFTPLGEGWLRNLQQAVFAAISNLAHSDRQLLHAYYVQRLQVDHIWRVLGVDRSTVYRRLYRAEQQVKHSIRSSVRRHVQRLSYDEIDSLICASYTRLELNAALCAAVRD